MAHEVTIADVAKRAGVSVTTVSNLINGHPERMRPSTEQRINDAIAVLGYTPNRTARQLKTGQTRIIGLIVPSVASPFFGAFARHVEQAALKYGYQVLLCNSERDVARETDYAQELWSYGVRGMIFGSSLVEYSHLTGLINRGLHVLAFGRSAQVTDVIPVECIGVDNRHGARLAVKHLLSLGHQRIGFVSGPIKTVTRIDRFQGYRSSLEESGMIFDRRLVWESQYSNFGDADAVDLGRQAAHTLFAGPIPPTAIFAINDMFAFGVYAGVRDLGLQIPYDLSIVGFDDIVLAEIMEPALTTVRQPVDVIAETAVRRLVAQLNGETDGSVLHQLMPARLIVRHSTATLTPQ